MASVERSKGPSASAGDPLRQVLDASLARWVPTPAARPAPFARREHRGRADGGSSRAKPTRVIALSSGKGGVGKTNLSVNLAIALGQAGHRVVLVDGDLGLANVDVVLGITPERTLEHVLRGECDLEQIVIEGPPNVRIVPGASGIRELANLSAEACRALIDSLDLISRDADFLLIDTAAGIAHDVVAFLCAAHEVVLVTTPDPTAMTDAYALLKVLGQEESPPAFHLVVNQATSGSEAAEIAQRILDAARRFLQVPIDYWGFLPRDPNLSEAVRRQVPALIAFPFSAFSRQIPVLVRQIEGQRPREQARAGGVASFLHRFVQRTTGQTAPAT